MTEESKMGQLRIEQNSFGSQHREKPPPPPPEIVPDQPKWYVDVLGEKKFNKEAKKKLPTTC